MTGPGEQELTVAQRLERFAGFRHLQIRVLSLDENWRSARILLPLNENNRNPGGFMFGGAQACLADPVAALCCGRCFPEFAVWTRRLHLDFQREGRSDLELRFEMKPEQEREIELELVRRGRATPSFEYAFYDVDGRLCTRIDCDVAIRSNN